MQVKIHAAKQGSRVVVFARVTGEDGALVTQATVDSVDAYVSRLKHGKADDAGHESLTVSSVIFDTAQTDDSRWTFDDGYNFRATIPGSLMEKSGEHQIDIAFTMQGDDEPIWGGVVVDAKPTYGLDEHSD